MDRRDPRPRSSRAAELPPGVFNLVHGGEATGRALVDAPVDGVAFTGSAEVGPRDRPQDAGRAATRARRSPRWAARTRRSSPPHADLDTAAEGVARAAFGLAGPEVQRLLARDRRRRRARRLRRAARRVDRRACRSATRPTARRFVGPVVNEAQRRALRGGGRRGARRGPVAAGGGRPDRPGLFVEPTVVSDLPLGHPLERDELFLPFVTVTRVGSLDEALAEANAPAYGLTAGIFSEDDAELDRFLDEIQAGVVYVNRRAGATTGRVAGHAVLLRLEVERLDRQGRRSARTTSRSSCASRAGRSSGRRPAHGVECGVKALCLARIRSRRAQPQRLLLYARRTAGRFRKDQRWPPRQSRVQRRRPAPADGGDAQPRAVDRQAADGPQAPRAAA